MVEEYVSFESSNNYFRKDTGFVRKVWVEVQDDKITIGCHFVCDFVLMHPSVVYSITDMYGNKLFGANAYNYEYDRPIGNEMSEGEILCVFNDVKLFKGQYFLTLWFGEENKEMEYLQEFLIFETENPVGFNMAKNYKDMLGPIVSIPKYNFIVTKNK